MLEAWQGVCCFIRKYGWIVYNGYLKSQKFFEQVEWLAKTAAGNGIDTATVKNTELLAVIDAAIPVLKGVFAQEKPDFILFWDKDVRMARHLEKMGFSLFNRPSAIEICDDKAATHLLLSNSGIKMPKTIVAPMSYEGTWFEDEHYCEYLEDILSYPMVVKEVYGSFGAQVFLVKDRDQLKSKRAELGSKPHIYQEFIASSYGRDVRLQVVGGQVAAGMLRKSESDFRANITAGGTMERFDAPKDFIDMAVKSTRLVGAHFAGVDMLFGKDGEPILCEINSNAHMKNLLACTGIDVTKNIIRLISEEIYNA